MKIRFFLIRSFCRKVSLSLCLPKTWKWRESFQRRADWAEPSNRGGGGGGGGDLAKKERVCGE